MDNKSRGKSRNLDCAYVSDVPQIVLVLPTHPAYMWDNPHISQAFCCGYVGLCCKPSLECNTLAVANNLPERIYMSMRED